MFYGFNTDKGLAELDRARQHNLGTKSLGLLNYQRWYWRTSQYTHERIRTYAEWLEAEVNRRIAIKAGRHYPAFMAQFASLDEEIETGEYMANHDYAFGI